MKYKLIKKLPFENSPTIGYISTPKLEDGSHYWNHNWFQPENYPEFWEEVVEKVKLPLFTSEDGVDIFEGDKLYSIDNRFNIKKHHLFNARYDDKTLLNNRRFFNSEYKHFSTKEKAEEYILLNKPCLSYKDIETIITTSSKMRIDLLRRVKDKIKLKIQQSV